MQSFLRHRFLFVLTLVPLAAHAACSASNGDAIPGEVRDAGQIEPGDQPGADGGTKPNDGGGTNNDSGNKPNDSGAKDAEPDSPAANPVVINEMYVSNQIGDGDNVEYVELRGTPGTSIADLKLRLLDKAGQVKYEVSAGDAADVFPADGLWSVGGTLLFDHSVGLASWGLDNDRGAVQLVRGANLLDVVGYAKDADAGALPQPASPPLATGEGKPVPIPTIKGRSFGRKADAADTNDNAADFCSMVKSAGTAQKPCD